MELPGLRDMQVAYKGDCEVKRPPMTLMLLGFNEITKVRPSQVRFVNEDTRQVNKSHTMHN